MASFIHFEIILYYMQHIKHFSQIKEWNVHVIIPSVICWILFLRILVFS